MQKILVVIGLLIAFIGLLYPYFKKLGLGNLPGDIIIRGENSTFYFPLVTSIVISFAITIIFNIFWSK